MPFKKTKHLVFSRYLSLLCLLLFLVVTSVFVAVSLGAVTIDIGDTYGVILRKLGFPIASQSIAKPLEAIIWNMRVPRVILGLVVGAGLSMSGSVMQSTVNNPIAEPYILGISAGATFGATLAIILGLKAVVGLGAFVGAILATVLVLIIASMQGRVTTSGLILSGTVVNALFIAFLARSIKQLFYLIRHLYKDQKPLALCHDPCTNQCFIATVISGEPLVVPCD